MTKYYLAALGLALAATQASADPHVDAMYAAIQGGNPTKAIVEADQVIAGFQAKYHKLDTLYLCGQTPAENLANMALAAKLGKSAVGVPTEWCSAHFVKGFAAVDLKQQAVAETELRRATEMAPFNAHYLNEYAELFKSRREWQRSYDLFAKAEDVASLYPEPARKDVHARSLRGMGFTKVELGDLDEAERLFKRSLEQVPGHPGALAELKYIADERAARK